MRQQTRARPVAVWFLFGLMLFNGIGALISGAMLFLAPDGHLLGLTEDILNRSLLSSYLAPGLILFLLIGVFPIFVCFSLLKLPGWRWPDRINPARKYHWAWSASWAVGIIMLIWIITETSLLGYISALQPVIAIWGLAIFVLTMLPATRRYCTR